MQRVGGSVSPASDSRNRAPGAGKGKRAFIKGDLN